MGLSLVAWLHMVEKRIRGKWEGNMFQARLCKTMDLSDEQRRRVYTKRLANAKISHANYAVRKYAANIRRGTMQFTDAIIAKGILRQYGVHPVLLDYAVKELQQAIQGAL